MNKKTHLRVFAALSLLLSGAVLAQTVVTVNGTPIDSKDVERRAKIFQANSKGQVPDSPALRSEITRELVVEALVTQEARRLKLDQSADFKNLEADALKELKAKGLDKDKDFKQNWADYRNLLLMQTYSRHLAKQRPITEPQLRSQYERIAQHFRNSDEVQLGLIVTDKAAQAQAALKELGAKKKFAEVAAKYSLRADAKQNGGIDPEYVPLKNLADQEPEIHAAVSPLAKGQYTKTPLKDGNISLILYVNDRRKVQLPPFERLKGDIEESLHQAQLDEAVDELGRKAKIVPAK
ncbi:peptidylprolyl isomerase [Conchiformibius kuhniae]|uniref:peptidylprolyl isomerase n=1 Tax=Conchiformibius kuhniae TaxID=211502 RepID=A0A8T9MWK9_9NEIS|nr:peptidyl-prolyl cis-trans isomerase [Conchiformibius kuhniae]UOP04818.1 peptidyl-prolyl cis-trans isomerase [Conchiformibius kuhniae]